jgi:hypothetical protein
LIGATHTDRSLNFSARSDLLGTLFVLFSEAVDIGGTRIDVPLKPMNLFDIKSALEKMRSDDLLKRDEIEIQLDVSGECSRNVYTGAPITFGFDTIAESGFYHAVDYPPNGHGDIDMRLYYNHFYSKGYNRMGGMILFVMALLPPAVLRVENEPRLKDLKWIDGVRYKEVLIFAPDDCLFFRIRKVEKFLGRIFFEDVNVAGRVGFGEASMQILRAENELPGAAPLGAEGGSRIDIVRSFDVNQLFLCRSWDKSVRFHNGVFVTEREGLEPPERLVQHKKYYLRGEDAIVMPADSSFVGLYEVDLSYIKRKVSLVGNVAEDSLDIEFPEILVEVIGFRIPRSVIGHMKYLVCVMILRLVEKHECRDIIDLLMRLNKHKAKLLEQMMYHLIDLINDPGMKDH